MTMRIMFSISICWTALKQNTLRQAYGVVADGLWQHYQNEGHSHYLHLLQTAPQCSGQRQAMRLAHHTLATWPTDMTIQPIMSDLPLDGGHLIQFTRRAGTMSLSGKAI